MSGKQHPNISPVTVILHPPGHSSPSSPSLSYHLDAKKLASDIHLGLAIFLIFISVNGGEPQKEKVQQENVLLSFYG